jgi:hypothetical protein
VMEWEKKNSRSLRSFFPIPHLDFSSTHRLIIITTSSP